jgi:plastocyanin domain-containing protein
VTASDWIAILAAVSAIAWVNWWFFFARRPAATATASAGGAQEVTIKVQAGYEPSVVKVKRGVSVRLAFDRQETSGCSEEIVFPDFGIRKFLPAFQKTTIELTPQEAGTFEFTCGMSMLHGKLIVES